MKKLLLLCISIFSISFLFGQNSVNYESTKTYRKACEYYSINDYGMALKYAEDAITLKKQQSEKEYQILFNSLSSRRVQAVGKEINVVVDKLQSRGETASIKIINNYVQKKGTEFFDNNIDNLLNYVKETSDYPEAQKLIGDIYKLEGEYTFAEQYYQMALSNEAVMDVPDFKYEILYELADISRLKNDENEMETRLLNILTDDYYFKDSALMKAMLNTIESNKSDSVEKLFTLYRSHSYYNLKAYNLLADYYLNKSTDKALKFRALSAITGFSKLYDTVEERNVVFEYTNLNDFMQECTYYNDLVQWASDNQIWESFNRLAEITTSEGYTNFSRSLLQTLVHYCPDSYWQKNAVLQLSYLE